MTTSNRYNSLISCPNDMYLISKHIYRIQGLRICYQICQKKMLYLSFSQCKNTGSNTPTLSIHRSMGRQNYKLVQVISPQPCTCSSPRICSSLSSKFSYSHRSKDLSHSKLFKITFPSISKHVQGQFQKSFKISTRFNHSKVSFNP